MKKALLTMVRDETIHLPIWLNYYLKYFPIQDIWVLDNNTVDHSTDSLLCNVIRVDHHLVRETPIHEPWVGFLHAVPVTNPHIECQYNHPWSLSRMHVAWGRVASQCRGLFTLCRYTQKYLQQLLPEVPVNAIPYPTAPPPKLFDFDKFNKRLILVGHWLRLWNQINEIQTSYDKVILKGSDCFYDRIERCWNFKFDDSVSFMERIGDDEYDDLLTSNLIFLPLHDCAACTTLVECVVRNTPVLIPKLEAVVECLGEDYPLYYNNLDEASQKIENVNNVYQAHIYLKSLDKRIFSAECFLDSLVNSEIYQNL